MSSLLAALNQGDFEAPVFRNAAPAILMEHAVIHDAGQLSDLGTIVSFSGERRAVVRKTNGLLGCRPVKRMSGGVRSTSHCLTLLLLNFKNSRQHSSIPSPGSTWWTASRVGILNTELKFELFVRDLITHSSCTTC